MPVNIPYFASNITYDLQLVVYDVHHGLASIVHHWSVIWLAGALLTPILVVVMLFLAAAGDIMQIIRMQISFSRLMGDLFHVLIILLLGALAEIFFLFKLFVYFFH